ncbi:MAG: DUF3347 domain-containing protein [Bdellovibrio sp.]|nr:DUF3347 domain-containing protein [Bdellovibrio sp.]
MKNFNLFVFVLLCGVLSLNINAAKPTLDPVMTSVLDSYLKIHGALAADTTQGVSEAAQTITKTAPTTQLKKASLTLSKEKDLKTMRERFKDLSEHMVKWARIQKPADIQITFCSMANARWLQKTGSVKNPYYGKEMLECGEIEKGK